MSFNCARFNFFNTEFKDWLRKTSSKWRRPIYIDWDVKLELIESFYL